MRAALEAGARALEWDLHVAACGTPVVIHDDRVDRTTDACGRVVEYAYEELARLDAGSWFSPEFAGERIPSLRAALRAAAGRVHRIYPEVKGYRTTADLERMVATVRREGLTRQTVYISMDWDALDEIRGVEPSAGIGYIVERPERFDDGLSRAERWGAILEVGQAILLEAPERAAAARRRGVPLAVWTVNEPERATALHSLGVTRFTTNEVSALLGWKRELEGLPQNR
jgi:glycerophosphoryl diester phosphodiesterase